jgi:hypothetical protein
MKNHRYPMTLEAILRAAVSRTYNAVGPECELENSSKELFVDIIEDQIATFGEFTREEDAAIWAMPKTRRHKIIADCQ